MKALIVGETRQGELLNASQEGAAFAEIIGAEPVHFLVGDKENLPWVRGPIYLADVSKYGEYSPNVHLSLLLEVVRREAPEVIVFSHSSYGWDLAPRLSLQLKAGQISEVVDVRDGAFVVPACNAKLRRTIRPLGDISVVTLQAGAFGPFQASEGTTTVIDVGTDNTDTITFSGYEKDATGDVALDKAEVIVSAGRGVGEADGLTLIKALAAVFHGEYGASRPIVDAGWTQPNRQIGVTGQVVSPKLYMACGISGAIQHLMGMKNSDFVVAINTDKDAPISDVADVMVVADLKQFVPVLIEKIQGR